VELLGKQQLGCADHSLDLAVKQFCGTENLLDLELFRKIVSTFHSSPLLSEKLSKAQRAMAREPLVLFGDVPTRWNSTFLMLQRLIHEKAPLACVLTDSKDYSGLVPTPAQWSAADWVVEFLAPFADISKRLEPSHNVTVTQIVPRLRTAIKDVHEKRALETNPIRQDAFDNFLMMFKKYFEPYNYWACHSLFYDPRFKGLTTLTAEESNVVRCRVREEVLSIPAQEHAGSAPMSAEEIRENRLCGLQFQRRVDDHDEVNRYLALVAISPLANPLEWWAANERLFPRLARLARKYLCVPATTVPSERAFSSASNVDTRHRHAMDPETLEKCVLIHHYFCEQRRFLIDAELKTIPEINIF